MLSHDHRVRIASCYLDGFVSVHLSLLQMDLPRAELRLKGAVTKLALRVPAPTVDLAKGRAGYGMAETTLNRVNALASLLEAADDLRDVIGVLVAQSELPILIVLPHSIHVPLLTDKEAEVVATADSLDAYRVTEGHEHGVAHFLALHGERPGKGFTGFCRNKVEITAGGERAHHKILL